MGGGDHQRDRHPRGLQQAPSRAIACSATGRRSGAARNRAAARARKGRAPARPSHSAAAGIRPLPDAVLPDAVLPVTAPAGAVSLIAIRGSFRHPIRFCPVYVSPAGTDQDSGRAEGMVDTDLGSFGEGLNVAVVGATGGIGAAFLAQLRMARANTPRNAER